ncbi:MAG: HEAT repeat domain-containing protein, partial [Elusimicrobiota bacterium]|nr:HEAT repeat domain-containing protein [Elusimicrobiota bacterium]
MKVKLKKFAGRKFGANPLTGLPGNRAIKKELKEAAVGRRTVIYVDITDFKPYNEAYGFSAGDNVIIAVAELLSDAARKYGGRKSFVGHIGGDDFIITCRGENVRKIFSFLDREFLNIRSGFYSEKDFARKKIVAFSRSGHRREFPLMGLCAAAFSPKKERLPGAEAISEFATHLKDSAKSLREKDNIFVTPKDINILTRPLKEYCLDESVALYRRRAAIEAMGESGLAHYGRAMTELLSEMPQEFSDKKSGMLIKKSILFSLGRMRYKPAEELIVKYTHHSSAHLRTRAVEALGNLGYSRHLDRIGKMIADENIYTAVAAVKSLGNIGHPQGLKYLKNTDSGAPEWLKIESSAARARLGDENSLEVLAIFLNDNNPVYRIKAARALGFLKEPRAVEYLFKAVLRERDYKVKKIMAESIAGDASTLTGKEFKKIESYLDTLYEKLPEKLKHNVLPLLGKVKSERAAGILRREVNSSHTRRRLAALEGLSERPCPENLEILK